MNNFNYKKGYTHGGVFHADDVFASALLKIVYGDNFPIERGFKPQDQCSNTLVFDIGGGEFDHHQQNTKSREDGIKYSSLGLVWNIVGETMFPKKVANRFDEIFIKPICAHDNGQGISQLCQIINSFNPNWDENSNGDNEFSLAVEFAKEILLREFKRLNSQERAKSIVEDALNKSTNEVVVLEQFAPWQNVLVPSKAQFVIYPSQRGGWNLQTIPTELGGFIAKTPLPQEWWGTTENFKAIGGTFCHNNGFISCFINKEIAIEVANSLVKEEK